MPLCAPDILACCAACLTASATAINPVSAATHHVMLSLFFFFCTVGDACSQAAQSFLPAVVRLTEACKSAELASASCLGLSLCKLFPGICSAIHSACC